MAQLNTLRLNRFHPRDLLLLVYLGPMLTILLQSTSHLTAYYHTLAIQSSWSFAIGLMVSLASFLLISFRAFAKVILSCLLVVFLLLMVNHLYAMPSRFLFVGLFIGLCFRTFLGQGRHRLAKRQVWRIDDYLKQLLFYATNYSLLITSAVFFFGFAEDNFTFAAVMYCTSLTLMLTFVKLLGLGVSSFQLLVVVIFLMIGSASAGIFLEPDFLSDISLYGALLPLANYLLPDMRMQLRNRFSQATDALFRFPEGAVLSYFLFLSLIGTLLLFSPISSSGPERLSLIDSAFTAVSAVCVTGLTVVSTVDDFSFWGQFFIMVLIEMGGLGIMTLSSFFVLIVGKRLSVSQEEALVDTFGSTLKGQALGTVRRVLAVTFTAELLGALVLSFAFWRSGIEPAQAIWKGIFTAVSAFCNAGFALESQSLMNFQGSELILASVSILIMLGGLSPAFVVGLPMVFKRGEKLYSN